jgi:PKHD-type hydroxylase
MQELFQKLNNNNIEFKIKQYKHKMQKHTFEQSVNNPQDWYWFQNGFTKEELESIYKKVDEIPFEKATILGGGTDIDEIRSSSIKWIPQTSEWEWLYQRLMDYAVEANNELWHFDLVSAPEKIQYTEYYDTAGGHYDWHQDIGPNIASQRKISLTVQLSDTDEYEDGNLQIWRGAQAIDTVPRGAGNVVIFPSYMMHRVQKVTKGTRRSFVLWIGGQHYK